MLAAAHATETFELLSVVSPARSDQLLPWVGRMSGAGQLLWRQAMGRLVHQAARLRKAFGVRCTAVLGFGSLAAQTMRRVDATAPGLVVLGWHARSWLGRLRNAWAFGEIARRSRQPVLVVRNAALRPYARVLVAVDFSSTAIHAVKAAVRCAPGARFTFLHALDAGAEGYMRRAGVADQVIEQYRYKRWLMARQAFQCFLERLDLPGLRSSLVVSRHPERAALRVHAASARPDLIVLSERQYGILGGLLGISAAQEVLAATPCDLLVIAPQAARRGSTALQSRRAGRLSELVTRPNQVFAPGHVVDQHAVARAAHELVVRLVGQVHALEGEFQVVIPLVRHRQVDVEG
jgi:nucleotide-binding universal stress UspA family protein